MSRRLKKFVSILLATVMVCSLVPFTVWAEETEPQTPIVQEVKTEDENTSTDAVFEMETKDTIVPFSESGEYELSDGINEVGESVSGKTFNVCDGKALLIRGTKEKPVVIENCVFNISGKTMNIASEATARIDIYGYVTFNNCKFFAEDSNGGRISTSGGDACIRFDGPEVYFVNSNLYCNEYQGQFIGLYTNAKVKFTSCTIETENLKDAWSYAIYSDGVLTINDTTMKATGTYKVATDKESNLNVFYAGDSKDGEQFIVENGSKIDFRDNDAGGIVLNNATMKVSNATINIENNDGSAANTGTWIVENSKIYIRGNLWYGLRLNKLKMENSDLESIHNGYYGIYIVKEASSITGGKVDVRCNGENSGSGSYLAGGDIWVRSESANLTLNNVDAWLGGVSPYGYQRTSSVINNGCSNFVAYDLKDITGGKAVLSDDTNIDGTDEHILFLNPSVEANYARGIGDGVKGRDDDLFKIEGKENVINADKAKIGKLTTAQLSHHKYDWDNGVVTDKATPETFGVKRFECVDICGDRIDWRNNNPYGLDCDGTYVYAPLMGLRFNANTSDTVKNMPENQPEIEYLSTAEEPAKTPERAKYRFTGWYLDSDCTQKFDFTVPLESNWTELYAGWEELKGGLRVSKTVSGNAASTTKEFTFTVTLDDKSINGEYGDMTFKDGEAVFKLKAGESKTANNLPSDTAYKVVESDNAGYTVTAKNNEGIISADVLTEVTFDNYRRKSSGGGSDPDYVPKDNDNGSDDSKDNVEIIDPDVPMADALEDVDHFAYIVGRPDGNVYPETEITRAEVATIFYRLLKEDVRKELWTKENPYPDVNIDDWFNVAVSVTTNGKIVHGYPDGTCKPNNNITRAEFATIAAQFLSSDYVGDDKFSDIDSHWAEKYINRAAQAGWIKGYPDGTFKPDRNITRAEAMTLINAVLGRTPDKDKLKEDMIKWPDNADTSKWYYAQVQEATNSHDYDRENKETAENWTEILPVRDWEAIERSWSDIYSSVNPGEVMD